jgi:hypothetical protein
MFPEHPEAAASGYNDSSWELLDLPHDYIVNGVYDQSKF